MAKKSGIGQALYLHGYDLTGDVGAVNTCAARRAALDVTALDKGAMERIYGLGDGEISFNCFFNDATGQEHDALKSLPTTDVLAMYLMGTTRGDRVATLSGKQVNYDWNRGADGSLLGTVQIIGAAGVALEWADLLKAKGTHASATDETGLDGSAQSTSGAVGYLQHFSAASGTVEYDIEDSSDSTNGIDGVWANLLAFSDVATPWARTAQRVAVAGTVERWVRASTNGTFTTAVFAMAFRRRLATDLDAA